MAEKLSGSPELPRRLAELVGESQVVTAPEELLSYTYDGSGRQGLPTAVVFPLSSAQIAAVLRLAVQTRTPVIPRGAGTGMCGGSLAVRGGIILALSRLNRIKSIDQANQLAVVQPGVITAQLQARVAECGLYYPPDPTSRAFCTIGGNVACGAGGPAAVKYGVTRDYVLGLKAVLAGGAIVRTGVKTAKGVVGYDLTRLLVGSEGTLAVISEITLRLIPLPAGKATFLLLCRDLQQATALVGVILAGLTPCALEYLDHTALQLVKDRLPPDLPIQADSALLLLEFDGDAQSLRAQSRRLTELVATTATWPHLRAATNKAEAASFWAARKGLSPAAFNLRPHKISEDVVVPRNRIPALVAGVAELAATSGLPIFTFGHAGDGNIHVNIMLNRDDPAEVRRSEAARTALYRRVLELGGTLSGEHGVGISKAEAIVAELGRDNLELMRQIKLVFDPTGILNPGKIFADPPPSAVAVAGTDRAGGRASA